MQDYKIVEFWNWCPSCKYADADESESPCNECLEVTARLFSHKPENWEEAK